MTGFNLPPGVNVSDIPGNRPEDEAEEAFFEHLNERFLKEHPEFWKAIEVSFEQAELLEDAIYKYVTMARDIGYERGKQDERESEAWHE